MQTRWSLLKSRRSSNWRELSAILKAILHFIQQLVGFHLVVRLDNMVAVAYLNNQGGYRVEVIESDCHADLPLSEGSSVVFGGSVYEGRSGRASCRERV